jgi:hypothetical protein
MAQIIQTSFVITISKLVKDAQSSSPILDEEQSQLIAQMLPGVVEEVLHDPGMIVEVQLISD